MSAISYSYNTLKAVTVVTDRLQAAGGAGVHCRRDAPRSRQAPRLSRNLIHVWVAKYEAGAFDDDARAADLLQEYEAKIAALERLVGRQAFEIEFLKGP
jgi:hypothetical protein